MLWSTGWEEGHGFSGRGLCYVVVGFLRAYFSSFTCFMPSVLRINTRKNCIPFPFANLRLGVSVLPTMDRGFTDQGNTVWKVRTTLFCDPAVDIIATSTVKSSHRFLFFFFDWSLNEIIC